MRLSPGHVLRDQQPGAGPGRRSVRQNPPHTLVRCRHVRSAGLPDRRRPQPESLPFHPACSRAYGGISGSLYSSCGETLLGVSREVFARSAFIGQSGLAITQDAGLERRIAALITSGEEDTSYSEAAGILKKELNRRRHNKTGQLPALEAELQETEDRLTLQRELARQLESVQDRCAALAERETALKAERSWLERSVRRQAEDRAGHAEQRAEVLARQAREGRLPEMETIGRLRGAIVNLETTRRAAARAREQRDEARNALLRAEAAVNESPFTGLTPEQAEKLPLDLPPRPRFPLWACLLALAPGASLAGTLFLSGKGSPLAIGCGCGLMGVFFLLFTLLTRHKQKHW